MSRLFGAFWLRLRRVVYIGSVFYDYPMVLATWQSDYAGKVGRRERLDGDIWLDALDGTTYKVRR